IGLGAGLIFHARSLETAAALAFIAALYHALNHTTFKGLLFMGAGAVLHATHTRDMNRMGGLIKRMPWTALFFLVGAVARSGLRLARFAVVPLLANVIAGLDGMPRLAPSFAVGVSLHTPGDFAQISPTLAAFGLLIVLVLVPLVLRALRVNRTRRIGDSWGC